MQFVSVYPHVHLLKNCIYAYIIDSLPAFDVCVWEGWMPAIRRAALNWNPRNNTPAMLHLVETWIPILPNWIVENLLEQVQLIFENF